MKGQKRFKSDPCSRYFFFFLDNQYSMCLLKEVDFFYSVRSYYFPNEWLLKKKKIKNWIKRLYLMCIDCCVLSWIKTFGHFQDTQKHILWASKFASRPIFFFSVDGTEEMTCHHTKMTNYLSNVFYAFSWTCHEPNVMLLACFTVRWTCPLLTQTLPYPVPRRLFLVLSYPTSSRLPFLLDIKNDIGSNVTLWGTRFDVGWLTLKEKAFF